jgi:hypothetical protein
MCKGASSSYTIYIMPLGVHYDHQGSILDILGEVTVLHSSRGNFMLNFEAQFTHRYPHQYSHWQGSDIGHL